MGPYIRRPGRPQTEPRLIRKSLGDWSRELVFDYQTALRLVRDLPSLQRLGEQNGGGYWRYSAYEARLIAAAVAARGRVGDRGGSGRSDRRCDG